MDELSVLGRIRHLREHPHHPYLVPVSLFIGALALRLWGIGSESIWTDEMATLGRAQMGLGELLENTSTHGQLPLYFGLLNLWVKVAGTDEVALRFPSAFIGSLNVLLAYQLIRRLQYERVQGNGNNSVEYVRAEGEARGGNVTGRATTNDPRTIQFGSLEMPWPFVGALIVATNPILIYLAQDARTYTLLMLASWLLALAVLAPLRWQRQLVREESCLLALGLLVLATSHYIGWVICLGVGVILLLHRRELRLAEKPWQAWGSLLGALVWIGLWLSYMQSTGNWPDTHFHESSTLADNLVEFGDEHLSPSLLVIGPILLACGWGYRAFSREQPAIARVCLLWVVAIIGAVLFMSAASSSYFVARYFAPIIVPLLILAGRGFHIDRPDIQRLALLVLVLVLALGQTVWQVTTPQKAQWREAAEVIEENMGANELVAVSPRWERNTLAYYLESKEPMSVEQVMAQIESEGGDQSIPGFWVVFRSDHHHVRDQLRTDLEDGFESQHVESVKSLQVWHFTAIEE